MKEETTFWEDIENWRRKRNKSTKKKKISKPAKGLDSEQESIDELKRDKIRLQIAIGLIAIYSAILYLIQKYISLEANILSLFLVYIFYGFYIFSNICLFLYIVFTGLHYKHKDKNYAQDYYFPERFRKAIYDFGLEMMVLGFLYSAFHTAVGIIQKYLDLSNETLEFLIGLVGGGVVLLLLIVFHQLFIDTEKKSK